MSPVYRTRDASVERLKGEILALEREAGNLVRFLAQGGDSETIREELRSRQAALHPVSIVLANQDPPG